MGMRWIVFDFGEVIGLRSSRLPQLAEMLGAAWADFEAAYWGLREAYDRGLPDAEYWRGIAARAGVPEPGDAEVAALVAADVEGWLDPDPGAVALLEKLHAGGHALALLSNAPSTHGEAFRRQPWAACFRHFLISGDVGAAKPDPEIWRRLTELLDAAPGDCLFLDDRQANVDGAATAGVRAHRWTGAEAAETEIAEFLGGRF